MKRSFTIENLAARLTEKKHVLPQEMTNAFVEQYPATQDMPIWYYRCSWMSKKPENYGKRLQFLYDLMTLTMQPDKVMNYAKDGFSRVKEDCFIYVDRTSVLGECHLHIMFDRDISVSTQPNVKFWQYALETARNKYRGEITGEKLNIV